MILTISGTPGTGKSTVAKLLGKRIKWKVIDLNVFAKDKNLCTGYDKKRGCDIVDVKKVNSEIKKLKGDLIIESHFAHDIKSDVTIILRTNPKELRKRLSAKDWKKDKIEENILAEIMEVCLAESLESGNKTIPVETTNRSPDQVVDQIVKELGL